MGTGSGALGGGIVSISHLISLLFEKKVQHVRIYWPPNRISTGRIMSWCRPSFLATRFHADFCLSLVCVLRALTCLRPERERVVVTHNKKENVPCWHQSGSTSQIKSPGPSNTGRRPFTLLIITSIPLLLLVESARGGGVRLTAHKPNDIHASRWRKKCRNES